jgi:serine/threonine-protein kinase
MEATAAALEAGLSRRFRIVRRLGAGGMGTVFLAEQIAVGNRPVALKVLLRKLLDDPEFLLRFQNEAASTGRIRHPNVVTIYESGQSDDGSPYIAMEFLEGETLRQTLKRRGALPLAECAEILQQIARGLNAAHKLGILHRDLKPDNIFITHTEDGERVVKVVDFGLAKMRESATHTLTGTVLGTPAYMSPEQCLGMKSEQLDARSDLYALGVIVYEMLTGRVPFHSDTPVGYLHKHITDAPPPLRVATPGLDVAPQVEGVVMKALAKEREQRQASVLDLYREFAAAASLPAGGDTPTTPTRLSGSSAPPHATVSTRRETPPGFVPQTIPPVATPAETPAAARAGTGSARKYVTGIAALLVMAAVAAAGYRLYLYLSNQPRSEPARTGSAAPAGMVAIPGGTFSMGRDNAQDPEETPAHNVTVAPFYLDKTPITETEYHHGTGPWTGDLPMTNVSWQEAQNYCTSVGGRLPTEAEWEFAAKGTDDRRYPWGNNFAAGLTNSVESGLEHLQSAGAHRDAASPFGVLGMSGNIWQWTADDYRPYPGREPAFQIPADAKVIRGGSYKSDEKHVTTTTRNLDHASTRSPVIGFRCAKSQ